MAADEEDPWGFDESETTNTATATEPSVKVGKTESNAKVEEVNKIDVEKSQPSNAEEQESKPMEEGEEVLPPPPLEDDGYRKPVQLYKHWVRPKFLQYKYMYNYRTNYYDDVIDYLDKRQSGVLREIPRAQTWAERVLRTNNTSGRYVDHPVYSDEKEKHLIQTLAASIRPYNYHSKAYVNMKYAKVL